MNQSKEQCERSVISPDLHQEVQILTEKLKQTQLAYQMAAQMSQFKGGFLARIAHELRSPLNGLIGAHQLILSDLCDDPAEERDFVAKAHASALKMVHMLDEIIDVSKAEHGTVNVDIQPVGLANIFQTVYQLTYLLAANRNIPFTVISPDPDIYVLAEPRRLKQVLLSLIDTAIVPMKEGGITLSASSSLTTETAYIWLDDESAVNPWSEPLDLLKSVSPLDENFPEKLRLSPGMMLLMNQNILEMMNGHLEFLDVPAKEGLANFTRVQCSLPLLVPEH